MELETHKHANYLYQTLRFSLSFQALALLRVRNKLIAEPCPSSRLLKYQQKFPVKAEMIALVSHLSV